MQGYLVPANSHIKLPRPDATGQSMTDTAPDASTDNGASGAMLALTTKIVAAYISKNATQGTDLPALIDRVFQSLAGLTTAPASASQARPEPAVPVKRSVFADHIVCLEDGKKLKMMKRHLMTSYGLTPAAYRERWGLPPDYPMVAPSYAEKRSSLARSSGLGRKPASQGAVAAESQQLEPEPRPETEEQHVAPIPKTRGRKVAKAAEAAE